MAKDIYVDTYGRSHIASKVLSSGGQGIVYKTEEPNTLIKLEWNPFTQEINKDVSNNEKFDEIRILPLLEKTNLTLPQTILRDVAGYTMRMFFNSIDNQFEPEERLLQCLRMRSMITGYNIDGEIRISLNIEE